MTLTGYQPVIPNENRRTQKELCDNLGAAKFLDHIWEQRDAPHKDAAPQWKWPVPWGVQPALPPLTQPVPTNVSAITAKRST